MESSRLTTRAPPFRSGGRQSGGGL